MQDKYVADIGDFGKYHLLRQLSESGKKQIGIVWCYSPGDIKNKNNDGKHIRYLGLTSDGSRCDDAPNIRDLDLELTDSDLFQLLRTIVFESRRSIAAVERDLAGYFWNQAVFVRDELPLNRREREKWKNEVIEKTRRCEILFLDPDNGLAEKAGSGRKHVTHNELLAFWGDGSRTVVVYHHPSRSGNHEVQLAQLAEKIQRTCKDSKVFYLRYRRGTSRAYFIIVPQCDGAEWELKLQNFLTNWRNRACSERHRTSWTEYGRVEILQSEGQHPPAHHVRLMPSLENLEDLARSSRCYWPQVPPWRSDYPDCTHLTLIQYVIQSERLARIYYPGLADEQVIDTAVTSFNGVQIVVRDQLGFWNFDAVDEDDAHDADWAGYYASKNAWKQQVIFQSDGPLLHADLIFTELNQIAEALCRNVLAKMVILVGSAGKFRNNVLYDYTEASGLTIGKLKSRKNYLAANAREMWAMYFP